MINVDLQGRLGNQLFIYAMTRKVQLECNQDEVYVNTYMVENYGWKNSLINYNIDSSFVFYNSPLRRLKCKTPFIQNLVRILYRKYTWEKKSEEIYEVDKKCQKLFKKLGMYICKDGYLDFKYDSKKKDIVLYGYYQCEKYFSDIRSILLKELTPKYDMLDKNKRMYNEIRNSNSVCVTMRIGKDFTENPIYNVCNLNYFKQGMKYMVDKVDNPKFFIFSDNPQWLKDNVNFGYDVVYEEGNDPDYEKLRIMSKCKHFIISNSSFSWWAQYLSENESKIVVAPDRWYNGDIVCNIYMDNWKIIKSS